MELRSQLKASVENHETMGISSGALAELRKQKQTTASLNKELTRQAVIIQGLKTQLSANAEGQMRLTRQVC